MMYKNIRVKIGKKPKSGPDTRKSRLQRVKVLASGKFKFVKNLPRGGEKVSKSKSKKSSKTKSTKKRGKRTTTKKKGGRRGGRILGNVGWKGMLAGIAGLTVTKFIARRFLPVSEKYVDGAAMVAVGALGKVAKIGTANLLPAGVMMLGSSFAEDIIFGGGVGFVAGAQGGYDL